MDGLISVIVPVYNIKPYLDRSLGSIRNQRYKNLEIIVVDDGSSDGSSEYLDEYKWQDNRIKVIHQKNMGVTAARLHGIRESSGEYIGFVDGDDEIEPDMYEVLMNNIYKYSADISHCGYQMIFEDGRVHYFHNTGCFVQQDRTTGLKDLLDGSLVEPGLWNKLFHKSLFHSLLQEERMPTDIKINEDLLMNFFLFSKSKCSVFEDVCKYHYIVRGVSASREALNKHMIYDPIKVRKQILDASDSECEIFARKAYVETCLNTYNSLVVEKDPVFLGDKRKVRDLLIKERKYFSLLSVKRRVMAAMATVLPWFYQSVYRVYVKCFQINPYM